MPEYIDLHADYRGGMMLPRKTVETAQYLKEEWLR